MFYLETKDGDKFFTDQCSDDKKEFDKIIFEKLGRDASELFESILLEKEDEANYLLQRITNRYKECITRLDKALAKPELDKAELDDILSDLQSLYTDFM